MLRKENYRSTRNLVVNLIIYENFGLITDLYLTTYNTMTHIIMALASNIATDGHLSRPLLAHYKIYLRDTQQNTP